MNEQEKTPALAQISPPFYGQECISTIYWVEIISEEMNNAYLL